jgi:sugar lactone lactonase YvrE
MSWNSCKWTFVVWILLYPSLALAHDYKRIIFAQDGAGSGAQNAVLMANPVNGNRQIISQTGVRGSGPDFGSLIGGLTVDAAGDILMTGFDASAVFKIDLVTGDRSILSGPGVGTGPSIHNVNELVVAANGDIFVTAQTLGAVVRIDPLTGNRTILSGAGVGSGASFSAPFGIALTEDGDFFVYDSNDETVTFVDALTGDRTIISGEGAGSGPAFDEFGNDLELLSEGMLVTTNSKTIYRVDADTGARSILSGPSTGAGPALSTDFLTIAPDGAILAGGSQGVYRVDPVTGDRTILSGDAFGTGPTVGIYRDAVVTVPEPNSAVLMGLAAIAALACAPRKSRVR